jgi:hypothetical protein
MGATSGESRVNSYKMTNLYHESKELIEQIRVDRALAVSSGVLLGFTTLMPTSAIPGALIGLWGALRARNRDTSNSYRDLVAFTRKIEQMIKE